MKHRDEKNWRGLGYSAPPLMTPMLPGSSHVPTRACSRLNSKIPGQLVTITNSSKCDKSSSIKYLNQHVPC